MRKFYLLLLTVLLAAFSNAQNIANYAFTPVSGSYTALVGGTTVPSIHADDATSASIPLGFTFYYMGVPYTSVAANSNGWLSFNASPTVNAIDMRTNDFATVAAGLHPLLAPVWDDLDGRTSVIPNPVASYLTTGAPGSRIFTFEWLNWAPFAALVPNVSYQVKLYEATSMVEFIYRQEGAATYGGASCGISNSSTSFASLNNLGVAPTVSNVTSTNSITALPATGQTYRFTPPTGVIAAPTTLTFSPVSRTSMTLNWVDNSTNETFFTVSRATAIGGPYTLVGNVASTTTAGTGTGYSFNSTGLLPGTTYYYRITASLEGSASPNLSGSQATNPLTSFSGAYTINPDAPNSGTNFTTWTEAVSSLNLVGVTGPTTFTVTGTAATITFTEGNLLLGGAYISGVPQSSLLTTLNSTNTLTFVAGPGKTINMSGIGVSTTIDYVFRLMGVDYVTFDGINIIDPVTNVTNTTQFEFGYVIGNASNGDGANNNTIKNFSATLFKANTGQANGPYGVLVQNGTAVVAALGLAGTNASRNNNNKIQNFTINGAKRGVTFSGLVIPAFDQGNEVSGPAFTSAAGGTWVGGSRITNGGGSTSGTDWGVGIDGQKDMKVFNVQVDNFIETNATPALSGIHFGNAVSTANGSDNAQVYNCVIHNLENNLSTASGVIGIRASGATLHTLKIYNNAIYDLRATIATGATVVVGALLTPTGAGSKIELYNNSINLPGALAAAGISKGFGLAGVVGTVVTAKNNVINFGTTGGGSTGGVIALDFGAIAPTLLDFSSNIYNVGTPSAARRVAVYASANRSALIDWQSTMAIVNGSSAGVDQRAGYGDPGFVSGTNLTYGAANSVENSGVPISGLATANDILGVARSASIPDVGIFEGNFSSGFVDVAAPGVAIDNFNRGTQAAEIRITVSDNVNTVGNITARLWYRLGVAGAFTALPPDVAPAGNNNGDYRWGTSIRALPVGTYQYYIVAKDAANNYAANPTMAPGAVSPGFASAPDPNWAGANPFASAGTNTFQVNGTPLAGGTYNVGATETYPTLTALAAELSARPISGNVIFELTNNYTGAGETFPIVFNQPSYTVPGPLTITIRPAAGVVTERVTSGDPGASNGLIVLDGMRDMILDGRPGGVGSSRMWRITNSRDGVGSLIGPAVVLQNDALRNTIKYVTLQSNSNTGLGGVINIGSTYYGGLGNSLNTIDNCDIGPNTAGTLVVPPNPVRGIAAVGGGTNSYNNNNTYSNNNIHDFHSITTNPVGIFIAGETGVTITGNSIYQTAPRSGLAGFGIGIAVNAATGPGINITNNYIGGSAPLCAGGPMTLTSNVGALAVFYAMQTNTGQYTSPSTISGNTMTNWSLISGNTTAGLIVGCGINPATGNNQFPLTITNNTIGSTTVDANTSPAITLTSTSTALPSTFAGVFGSVTGGVVTINNNQIGGVKLLTTGTGTSSFIGIQHQTAGVVSNIDNNVIGSLATANNIVQNTNTSVTGIANTSTLTLSNGSISNNTIANIIYNATVAGTSQTFTGISGAGTAPLVINGNTIRDITGNNHTTVTGISMASSGVGTTINNNTIRNWTINPQTASTIITVQGIQVNSSTSVGTISKNVIHSLINGSTSTSSLLRGIQNNFGTNWTYSNNMVSLGAGVAGDIIIRGMDDFSDAPTTGFGNYYYNTVSIGGSVAAGTTNTYAFYRSTSSTPMTFRNNIFSNTRTGGTGFHVAMANPTSATGWPATASDYNDLYSSNPATVAQWLGTGAGNNRTLAGWQASQGAGTPGSGGDANSKSALPVFISATDLHLSTTAGANWCLNGSGIVIPTITTDIDGDIRSLGVAPLGPDMGADEFVAVGSVGIATPAAQAVCSGTAITTIVLSGGAASYSWTRDNTVAITGIPASGTGNISGTLTNTTASPVTVTFTISPLNADGCLSPSGTFIATVTVNLPPDVSAVLVQPTTCVATNGSIFLTVSGGTGGVGPYSFLWAGPGVNPTSQNQTNLGVGSYSVTVTDIPSGCNRVLNYTLSGPGGCGTCPTIGSVTTNPTPAACAGASVTFTASGLTSMGVTYGITFKYSLVALPDPYVGGTVIGTVANGSLTAGGTVATLNASIAVSGNYIIYAILSPTPTDPLCRPSASTLLTVNPTPNATVVTTPGTLQVIITGDGSSWADEITWTLRNSLNTIILSGGPYGQNPPPTPSATVPAANPPFTFFIEALGTFNDNACFWEVRCNGNVVASGCIRGAFNPIATCPSIDQLTVTNISGCGSSANQTICSGAAITPIQFTGTVPGTVYNWTRDNTVTVTGTIGASGTGTISGTLINTTAAPILVTFTITPVANGCSGTPINATVLVNPTPNAVATPSSQTICSGTSITPIVITGAVGGTVYNWVRNNTATVTGIGATGIGNINGILTNTTSAPVTVTFTITPVANGCPGTSTTATVLVNPSPTVNQGGIQVIITGDGASFADEITWTLRNSLNAVILSGGPYGFSPPPTPSAIVPAANAPFTFFITALGFFGDNACFWEVRCDGNVVASGCIRGPNNTGSCPSIGSLTVPNISGCGPLLPQTICSGSAITPIVLGGPVAGTVFNWTRNNTATVTGIPASGTGTITGTLTNTTNAPILVTFTITPSANGCTGPVATATVLVNPIPNAVAAPTTQTVCSGVPITPIVMTGNVSGTTYNWTRNNTVNVTGIAASGSGNISGTLNNVTGVQQTVTFTITPVANGCSGTPITATVIVQGALTITCPANITVPSVVGGCTAVVAYAPVVTGTPAPTVTYSFSGATTGSGNGTGSGSTFNVGVTTVTITATNSCGTVNCSFTITVGDSQLPVISQQPSNQTVCAGSNASFSVVATNATSYQWQSWNGTIWVNIPGANASTLTLNSVTFSMNTNSYRVIVIGLCTSVTSTFATLFVNALPTVSLLASGPLALLPAQSVTLTAIVNPAGGTYQWFKNGVAIPGATSASLVGLTVSDIGTYRVRYTDLNGCVATSADMTVSGQVSDGLFIYPVPNDGHFHVRFYNQANEEVTVRVFDMRGALIYLKKVTTTLPYTDIDVDMRNRITATETYLVEVRGGDGRLIGAKKIIVVH